MACFLSWCHHWQCNNSESSGFAGTPTQWDSYWHCNFLSQRSLLLSRRRVVITSSQSNWIYESSCVISRAKSLNKYTKQMKTAKRDLSLWCLFALPERVLPYFSKVSFLSLFSQSYSNVEISQFNCQSSLFLTKTNSFTSGIRDTFCLTFFVVVTWYFS